MPRVKATKKSVEEINDVENGRSTKKTEEKKNAGTSKSKAGRGAKKGKEDTNKIQQAALNEVDNIPSDVEENAVVTIKQKTGQKKKEALQQNGEVKKGTKKNKKAQEPDDETSIEEKVGASSQLGRGRKKKEEISSDNLKNPETITKTKASRGQKKEEANNETTKQEPKGRKRKATPVIEEMITHDQNVEPTVAKKAATKRGRAAKSSNVNDQNEININDAIVKETSKKKIAKVAAEIVEKKPKKVEEIKKSSKSKKDKVSTSENAAVAIKKSPDLKKSKSRKRTAAKTDNDIENDEEEDSKPSKSKKPLLNSTETVYNKADFELTSSFTIDGNIKISSWNVAGLRSWVKKDGLKFLEYEKPDIFCMQEIKCTIDQLPEEAARVPGYHPYWLCLPGGYAGVALYSKIMPINVEYGIGNDEFDAVGRLITAEYEKFYLVNVYVPNSGRKLVNLEARMRWEKLFQTFVKKLDARKPVIIAGDMNCSHNEIDLANPKSNTRSAGFTKEEREKMTELLNLGYVDTFRHLYPDKRGAYTYWTYMSNARARNVGWRLDYFIVSERINKRVVENAIRSQCLGSDHCPITLFINM